MGELSKAINYGLYKKLVCGADNGDCCLPKSHLRRNQEPCSRVRGELPVRTSRGTSNQQGELFIQEGFPMYRGSQCVLRIGMLHLLDRGA